VILNYRTVNRNPTVLLSLQDSRTQLYSRQALLV